MCLIYNRREKKKEMYSDEIDGRVRSETYCFSVWSFSCLRNTRKALNHIEANH